MSPGPSTAADDGAADGAPSAGAPSADAAPPAAPLLRIVRGDPTPGELAALVAVVAARTGAPAAVGPPPRSAWRVPLTTPTAAVTPGGWVASGRVPGLRTKAGW